MLTVTSLGGTALLCRSSRKSLLVFPEGKKAQEKTDITFLPSPEEEPKPGVISWPGEYDIDGVAIRGIGHDEGRQVSYAVDAEGTRCALISSPLREWTDHELELLGDIDVLAIPADDVKLVQKLVDEIDPRVLIPLPTKDEKTFDEVLRVCGAQGKELVEEYKMKGALPAEGREVVLLKQKK
jgi:hypothetical protein